MKALCLKSDEDNKFIPGKEYNFVISVSDYLGDKYEKDNDFWINNCQFVVINK